MVLAAAAKGVVCVNQLALSVKHSDFWAQKSIANNQDAMRAAKSRDGELICLGQAPSLVPLTVVGEKAVLMFHSMGWRTTAQ